MAGAVAGAEHLTWSNPDSFMPQQFKNAANPEIHFKTTGPERRVPTGGRIGGLVSGVGTGGTISGIARYIDPSDSGRRYLTGPLFEGVFDESGLPRKI